MKILHLLASNKFSGAEKVAIDIIKSYSDNYEMAYCSPKGPIETTLKEDGIKFFGLDKFNKKCIEEVIEKIKPDIIHAHDFQASYYASKFASTKIKVISHIHNYYTFMHPKLNPLTITYRKFSRKFSRIIVVSEIMKKSLSNEYFYNNVLTLHNTINVEDIIQKSAKMEKATSSDLIFVGRLVKQKRPLLFIKIIELLKHTNCDILAIMLGEGRLYTSLSTYTIKNSLSKNVKILGFKENPYPYIINSKILIITSKYEGYGIVIDEAIELGIPVLALDFPGVKEHIGNEYVFNNICKLSFMASELLNDAELRKTIANNQQNMIYKFIKWDNNEIGILRVYQELSYGE